MKSVLSVKEASTFLQMDEKTLKSGLKCKVKLTIIRR